MSSLASGPLSQTRCTRTLLTPGPPADYRELMEDGPEDEEEEIVNDEEGPRADR